MKIQKRKLGRGHSEDCGSIPEHDQNQSVKVENEIFPSTVDRFKDKITPITLSAEEKFRLNYVIMNMSMYDAGLPFIPETKDSDSESDTEETTKEKHVLSVPRLANILKKVEEISDLIVES